MDPQQQQPLADFIKASHQWLYREGPMAHSIVSSRARYARNLPHIPFAPRARKEQLRAIVALMDKAIGASDYFKDYRRLPIAEVNSLYRYYLKESHLLSSEMESGGEHCVVYVSPDYRICLMINEEDHLRIQVLEAGFQLPRVLAIADEVEAELARHVTFAYSDRYGYLTACPTNVGTGLRLSVMLHLPGLVLIDKAAEVAQSLNQYGLTARGIYGENSDNLGDFFQVSNEVTLGKNPQETLKILESVALQIINHESAARDAMFDQKPLVVKDLISRALALLQHAHIMDSTQALTHLSKIRLGIDRGYFRPLTHQDLSRLMIEVQPAHLQCMRGGPIPSEQRDNARALFLQRRLKDLSYN